MEMMLLLLDHLSFVGVAKVDSFLLLLAVDATVGAGLKQVA
jgi:hypothetical protein